MAGILNTLQELVVSVCDKLYAERQLITKTAVKNLILPQGAWSETELDQYLPRYINEWRLHNLQEDEQTDLAHAQQTIKRLQDQLQAKNQELKNLRADIIRELRGLLNG